MQLGGLIFVHFNLPPKQAAVAVVSSGDGGVVVRLGGRDDPRPAAPPEAADPAQHRARRREISEDHVEPLAAPNVAADASPPAVADAQWSAELPLQRASPFAV